MSTATKLARFSQLLHEELGFWTRNSVPYRWGGKNPSTGFDCNGFVNYVLRKAGYVIPEWDLATLQEHTQSTPDTGWGPLATRMRLFFDESYDNRNLTTHTGLVLVPDTGLSFHDGTVLHCTASYFATPVDAFVADILQKVLNYADTDGSGGVGYTHLSKGNQVLLLSALEQDANGTTPGSPDWDIYPYTIREDDAEGLNHGQGYDDWGYRRARNIIYRDVFATAARNIADYLAVKYGVTGTVGALKTVSGWASNKKGFVSRLLGVWNTFVLLLHGAGGVISAVGTAITGAGPTYEVSVRELQDALLDGFTDGPNTWEGVGRPDLANGVQQKQISEMGSIYGRYLTLDTSLLAGWLDSFDASEYPSTKTKHDSVFVVNQPLPQ